TYLYEKFRNEKSRSMENPFKFGTIVEGDFFTDRVEEVAYIRQFVESQNHLIIISPRRFGKSSVVMRAMKLSGRKYIFLNLQKVVSVQDFAAKLLTEIYKRNPIEKLRGLISRFRIVPTLATNALTGAVEVSFQPVQNANLLLEDVFNALENIGSFDDKLVVVLDEFQEILDIAPNLDKQLRAIMQEQKNINYILLGSQESMMEDIFEKKKSPFYHFGQLMHLKKLPRNEFEQYISSRLKPVLRGNYMEMTKMILDYTDCHPYYSQQLASQIWQIAVINPKCIDVFQTAIRQILETHNLDFERIWIRLNRTDKNILQRLASDSSLSMSYLRTSTIYSALKKMQKQGFVIYSNRYEIEDPFFKKWILDFAS
ncbi:MAG: ATP-binding protein, partial [Bacteroidales bacterium]|nr:ATP-binding protein [Bacteroidales bacterium]